VAWLLGADQPAVRYRTLTELLDRPRDDPDDEGALARWHDSHPTRRPLPLRLEDVGWPSKPVTLPALTVLRRLVA
jgi:hypothetical protein